MDPSQLLAESKDEENIEDSSIDDIEEELDEYTKLSGVDKMYENDMIEIEENNVLSWVNILKYIKLRLMFFGVYNLW